MSLTAIIAGQGALPGLLAGALAARGERYLVAEMEGFPSTVPGVAPVRFRIERLVPFLDHLAREGVSRVVLAGAVRRPKLEPELFDARTATLMPRLLKAMQSGDDAALREVIAIFEDWDFTVAGAAERLPDLLPPAGILTQASPGAEVENDAALGEATVAEMGRADIGQACVVRAGLVVAREGPEGTDAMLAALLPPGGEGVSGAEPLTWAMDAVGGMIAEAADWLSNARPGEATAPAGGILFKAPKPGQDRRADLPVIGVVTALRAVEAGLDGIVIEAGGVMVIDPPGVVDLLDRRGMFLWVRPRGAET